METLFLIFFFIIGAIFGSFYHVVATRLAKGESIIYPGSHCTKCNHKLKWYENIPLVSYLMLRGKCSNCKTSITPSYFIVELVTAMLFAVCYHCFGLSFKLVIVFFNSELFLSEDSVITSISSCINRLFVLILSFILLIFLDNSLLF